MTVSEEEVIWCYRMILGREPESRQAITEHMRHGDVRSLREAFLRSPEFVAQMVQAGGRHWQVRRMALDVPSINIDYAATDEKLRRCLEQIGLAWSHLGKTAPHFSVLTNDLYRPDALEDNIGKFWASGENEAECVVRMLARHGSASTSNLVCVEYGCGVGRVTAGLAKNFAVVHAYDISPGHLSLAEARVRELGLASCQFHLCTADTLDAIEACDVFYSRIVFQHNPPPIIVRLIENALRSLRPNGIGIFQVPTYGLNYQFALDEWLATDHGLGMQMHCLPQNVVLSLILAAKCEVLEVREDASVDASRFLSNIFVVRKIR